MLSMVQDYGRHLVFRTLIPRSGIPEWFNHQKDIVFKDTSCCHYSKVYIDASPNWNNSNFMGFAFCVVLGLKDVIHQGIYYLKCTIESGFLFKTLIHDFIPLNIEDGLFKSDHLWLASSPIFPFKNRSSSSHLRIIFSMHGNHRIMKNFGVRLLYTEDMSDDNATMIQRIYVPQPSCVILEENEHPKDLEDSVSEDAISRRSLYESDDRVHTQLCLPLNPTCNRSRFGPPTSEPSGSECSDNESEAEERKVIEKIS